MRPIRSFLIFFTLCLTLATDSYARPIVATVSKLRGNATQLRAGALQARKIKVGDGLVEDTSIVTGEKSFVQVTFLDSSQISLGPKSKVVITEVSTKDPSIVTLLKGKLRTEVQKIEKENKQFKNKMFIRTRSAAMGVRGTEFQTIYNPDNKITSVLTYEGEVSMAKVDNTEDLVKEIRQYRKQAQPEKVVETTQSGSVEVSDAPEKNLKTSEKLDTLLETEKAVVVKPGQYSGTVENLDKASLPVKVSPAQLNALYKNKEFVLKDEKSLRPQEASVPSRVLVQQAEQEAPPEGVFNKEKGIYAPKAGGLIDLETGLYIPPDKNSDFDEKRKIFIPKTVGKIDQDSGEYIPPEGLELLPKGFTVKDVRTAALNEEKGSVLIAQTKELNQNIGRDFVVGEIDKSKLDDKARELLSSKERITKNTLEIDIHFFNQKLENTNTENQANRSVDEGGQKSLLLSWSHASSMSWQLVTSLGIKQVDLGSQNSNGISQPSDKLFYLFGGIRKHLHERWSLLTGFAIDQNHFINYINNSGTIETEFTRVALTRLSAGFEGSIIRAGRFWLDFTPTLLFNFAKETGQTKVKAGLGYRFDIDARYWTTPKVWFSFGTFLQKESNEIKSGNTFKADSSRSNFGLGFGFGYLL